MRRQSMLRKSLLMCCSIQISKQIHNQSIVYNVQSSLKYVTLSVPNNDIPFKCAQSSTPRSRIEFEQNSIQTFL